MFMKSVHSTTSTYRQNFHTQQTLLFFFLVLHFLLMFRRWRKLLDIFTVSSYFVCVSNMLDLKKWKKRNPLS